jgi:hypothetical protein
MSSDFDFVITELITLPGDRIAAVGECVRGVASPKSCGTINIGEQKLMVEVLSLGITSPRPKDDKKEILQLRVLGGDPSRLKGQLIRFRSFAS